MSSPTVTPRHDLPAEPAADPLTAPWMPGPPPSPRRAGFLGSGRFAFLVVALVVAVAALLAFATRPAATPPVGGERPVGIEAVITGSAPASWDPALVGDAGSASTLAQVYEGLTAFDPDSRVHPALAQAWQVEDEGRRLVFRMRPGVTFSDGSPITADDVVASWMRVIDPARPGPLAGLLADVRGAAGYMRGEGPASDVGLRAEGDRVVVEFRRPAAAAFVSAAASPTLAVLPAATGDERAGPELPDGMVVSGAYLPVAQTETSVHLEANPRYWAGEPPLAAIELLTDLEGESPVALFEEGRVDHTDISAFDATWIRYDPDLGPQLRHADAFSVDYYGFDTTEPPFDDARVRRAFAQAVDWDRIARLADAEGEPATSLVAAGIPGRGEADRSPVHDPDAARVLLEEAGFPDGDGFPEVRITGNGLPYDQAVAHELSRELSVTVRVEVRPFDEYAALLDADPPQMWSLSWIADYPHPHAFLGLLLETGSSSNEGRWSDPAFDAALDRAALEVDPAGQAAAYDAAEAIVQRSAPLIPVAYGETWSLSRSGLLGATESGVGFKRFASLRWADGP